MPTYWNGKNPNIENRLSYGMPDRWANRPPYGNWAESLLIL